MSTKETSSLPSSSSSTLWQSFRKSFVDLLFSFWRWMCVWLFRNTEEHEIRKEKEKEESSQGASTSSPSSSSIPQWKYEVFLSFRGVDTRRGFTDHLYAALQRKGIVTFRDDEKLERGKSISPNLLKTIEESRIAVVIFSKNYASSTWCLDELVKIVTCMRETGLTILPVFYDVNPCDVRKQMGTFGQAFNEHEEHFKSNMKKVKTWRAALSEVANLSGWHLQDRHESKFIQDIVEVMLHKLSSSSPNITNDLIGIESSVEKLITSYLDLGNNVCMIGVCGMGGLGKTTLARVVYEKFCSNFDGSSFIANIREESEKHGLPRLQQQLLVEILDERDIVIWNVYDGVEKIEKRLRNKKVLVVLDDVSTLVQLEKLAGSHHWFGLGSWIIITTRDEHLLVQHGVRKIYKPNGLNKDDALKLLCLKAFKNKQPKEDFMQLCNDFVCYIDGLPLALVTLGSFLVGRTKDEWQSAFNSLKKNPKREIYDILKVSYDGLEKMWQEMFLDIACFFRSEREDRVIEILENCGFDARIGICVLIEKSLLTITNKILGMHDLLREMGREIVCQESYFEPGNRSRLWRSEDLYHVFTRNKATEATRAIVQNSYCNFEASPDAFSEMCNLRLLIIHGLYIGNGLNRVPDELRFLSWSHYSSECLQSGFQPKGLLKLELENSYIEYLWRGVKHLDNLKFIDLKRSKKLISTPDLSGVPRLERLYLCWCTNLVEIHPSIGQLSKLIVLDLEGCYSLINLPSMTAKMESFTILNLCECLQLKKFPEFKGIMKSLSELCLAETAIESLPSSSIKCLTALTLLNLRNCRKLTCLPSNMDSLRSLEKLILDECCYLARSSSIENLFKIKCLRELDLRMFYQIKEIGFNDFERFSLKYLNLSESRFVTLPASISQLSKLEALELSGCNMLQSLQEIPSTVRYINAEGCTSLKPSPALLRQSSLSQPCSQWGRYNESSGGVAFEILNRYLQGLLCQKSGHETSTKTKEGGFGTEFQIIIPGISIPRWLTHQRLGNSVSIKLPPNWCNSSWVGFALCACFEGSLKDYIDVRSVGACEIALGDESNSHHDSKLFFNLRYALGHIWLSYLSSDDWFATIGNGACRQITVVFYTHLMGFDVRECGVSLVYKQEMEEFNQTIAQCNSSRVITYEGWDGVHQILRRKLDNGDNFHSMVMTILNILTSLILIYFLLTGK